MKQFTIYNLQFTILAVFAAMCFSACEPNKPEEPQSEPTKEVIPSAFPKKHLIEEFTGQGCGYCPYGMDCIHEFVGTDTNWIMVLHHYGYQADHFSVAGSKTITSALSVSGAPSMAINRAKTKYGSKNDIVFHPGYLENVSKKQFEDSTYSSLNIANSYDASSRELKVKVSGLVGRDDIGSLQLTVLVKESGMIDTQADYNNTFEGWQEFRHTNAVRAFMTAPKGDAIEVNNQHYSAEYTVTLNNKWVAENCMVVAFLSEAFKPIIQAEQKPVVAGTQGGADIMHGGITPVPIADYYPEPNASQGPGDISDNRSETLSVASAYYTQYATQGITLWQIQTYNTNAIVSVSGTSCIPFARIYLVAPYSATPTLPEGTFHVSTTEQAGTVIAGQRDDAHFEIFGSMFYFTSLSYFQQGYLDPKAKWLISDGELTISADSWSLSGHARNGAAINLTGSTPITNGGRASLPAKVAQRAGMICK